MTAKEKANELFNKMYKYQIDKTCDISWFLARKCALVAVTQIEDALTNYGAMSDELQNMDSEWRFWSDVKTELNNL